MTPRKKIALRIGLAALVLSAAVALWKREQVVELVRLGRALVAVQFLTSFLPDCDKVEVYFIKDLERGEKGRPKIPEDPAERFVLETQGGHTVARVVERKELTGAEAVELVRLWRSLRFGAKYQHLCHQPGYGLRFHSGATVRFDTSLCFECMNFPLSVAGMHGTYGFDGSASSAVALLQRLQLIFPASIPKPRTPAVHKQSDILGQPATNAATSRL